MIKKYLLIIILILAAVLRIYRLGSIPPHLTQDEAALGYNAYSILKTARDEHGKLLPIVFESFGDYKPGLYVYAAVPFVAVGGLNEWSVRLPSALAGVFSVYVLYLIILEYKKRKELATGHWKLEIIGSFLLAISPWHIHFSRGAWEANLSLALTLLGILFFLRSLENKKKLILSAVFFALTSIAYQGAKLSTSIVLFVLAIVFWRYLKTLFRSSKTILFVSIVGAFLVSSPILLSASKGQLGRLRVFSVFSYPRQHQYLQDFLDQGKEKVGDLSYYLFHSEINNFARGVMGRWFNHFSGRFLFFEGDYQNPRHSPPYQGVMFLFDIIFLPIGLALLAKDGKKFGVFVISWLILSPLPAVLSRDQVQAVRSLNMSIPLILASSCGFSYFLQVLKKIKPLKIRAGSYLFMVMAVAGSFIYYLDSYCVHMPQDQSKDWGYGYKQVFNLLKNNDLNKKKVYVGQSYSQPYIYYLFFNKYDPISFQKQSKITKTENIYDVGFIEKIDDVHFTQIKWGELQNKAGSIIIAGEEEFPYVDITGNEKLKLLEEVEYLDGKIAFRIIEVL